MRSIVGLVGVLLAVAAVQPSLAQREVAEAVTTAVREICVAPDKPGQHTKIEASGTGGVTVRLLRVIGAGGLSGDVKFTKEEWDGLRPVLVKDQKNDNDRYRLCVERLTPLFLERLSAPKEPQRPAINWRLTKDGDFVLDRSQGSGAVKNLELELFSTINAVFRNLDAPGQAAPILATIVADGAGWPYQSRESNPLFALPMGDMHASLLRTRDKVADSTNMSRDSIVLWHFACARIEFDDELGGHHRRFFSLRIFTDRPVRERDLHESQFFFQQCKQDYETYKVHPSMYVKMWSDGGRNLVAEKIATQVRR